jgi:hypothetical protein
MNAVHKLLDLPASSAEYFTRYFVAEAKWEARYYSIKVGL